MNMLCGKLSPIHLYGILVINNRPWLRLGLCNNKDTMGTTNTDQLTKNLWQV